LGDDTDTTAAVAGQLAGAIYGLSGIPERWRNRVAWPDRLEDGADALHRASADEN
jgi:ADP-ribosyl-[dinitrogen reductase] hydrolase